ncbi:conserved protein, unknown function [Hepatocystis sp. ex Piliocolobus tephrosceles]|nr:conserved protein, unknown function [Hepatocystis sp. ex Piliocolobus tephrosceles]
MVTNANKNNNDDWELHPLFLSKIPKKQDIDKNSALAALITLINEEENEVSNYQPKRKNLKKKVTDNEGIIYRRDRRDVFAPYQSKTQVHDLQNHILKNVNNNNKITANTSSNETSNHFQNEKQEQEIQEQNGEYQSNVSDENDMTEKTSIGEVLVCLSMMNLKQ